MPPDGAADFVPLSPEKFKHPAFTADGQVRATVPLGALRTLWFNTGTLCNLTCRNCYIESSPTNDRLVYLTLAEVSAYLDEIAGGEFGTDEIGFTGGEPFMNPDLPAMIEAAAARDFKVIVLTNAMKPMMKVKDRLLAAAQAAGPKLTIRVSLDHHTEAGHEAERGPRSWEPTIEGLKWLVTSNIRLNVAGRTYLGESQLVARAGYARLFRALGLGVDAANPAELVLFPEMDARRDVPEITTACWGILKKSPSDVMCASSRMVVKRKGAERPAVVACTLLPYQSEFELGTTLADARKPVALNHPHCAKFCVLGGASCSAG
ncbi:MAG: radical SAM protein [Alphaproteobacteria bacterium]|nr:radical SAM protein [Alphaproteobacteria bacterium]